MLPEQSLIYHGGSAVKKGWPTTAAAITQYIADGASEGNSSTTSAVFQNKLSVPFVATLGVRYKITFYAEIEVPADEDGEIQGTVNGTQYVFCHFKNLPFATRWSQMNGGHYLSTTLNGAITVNIDWRNGFGGGNKTIRRARILVVRID